MEVSREHFRAMMFYDFKAGLSKVESLERLRNAFGYSSPSQATVYRWFKEFQKGRGSLEDEERAGRPVTAVTDENILAVERMLREDNRVTYTQIQATLNIGSAAVRTILHDKLGIRKLCSRWIPYHLTDQQKKDRVRWCQEMLEKFDNGCSEAIFNILTRDESWIYQYEDEPEAKQQSATWIFPGETLPTKMKRIGKKMVCSFFCAGGHIETIAPDQDTVTPDWYSTVCLPQVLEKFRYERPETGLKGIFLHHDNALIYSVGFLKELGIQVLYHPPYSPDLAPCDFFLFPKAKECIRGRRFESPETAVAAYKEFLNRIPKDEWRMEFDKWFDRMKSCIRRGGEYCEKIHCNFDSDINQNDSRIEAEQSNLSNDIRNFSFSLKEEVKNEIDIEDELKTDINTYIETTNENLDKAEINGEQMKGNGNDSMIGQYETVIIKAEVHSEDEQEASKLAVPSNSETIPTSTINTTSPQFIKVQSVQEVNGMSEIRLRSLKMLQKLIQPPQYMRKQIPTNNNLPVRLETTNMITEKEQNRSELSDNRINNFYPKPAYSYSCLIAMALKNSLLGGLTVTEIYNFICQHFPYFKTASDSWKNSIRYNLSMNTCFVKCPGTRSYQKGSRWTIAPGKMAEMNEMLRKWSRENRVAIKKAMLHPDRLEFLERGETRYSQSTCSKNEFVDTESSSDDDVHEIKFAESIQNHIAANSVKDNYEINAKINEDISQKQQNVFDKGQKSLTGTVRRRRVHQPVLMTRKNVPLLVRTSIANCSFIDID